MPKDTLPKYLDRKARLLSDESICEANRNLFRRFFDYEEHKLKRSNGISQLDAGCIRTLDTYIYRFQNVNRWFENKPFTDLTEDDIRRVYDGLEDGKLLSARGVPFANRHDYYRKVFKSKLFRLAGKDSLARAVIEFSVNPRAPVRFVRAEALQRVYRHVYQLHHQVLFWLAWDIGENINSLLQLRKDDFTRQQNPDTREPEYRIHLRAEILKRSRTPRSEITIHRETVELLDRYLPTLSQESRLFGISYHMAVKFLTRAATAADVRCEPNGERLTWKDLRSSMACHLLSIGWTREQINARLGHTPSSAEIDKYISFLAIDRHVPKKKVHEFEMSRLANSLADSQTRERAHVMHVAELRSKVEEMEGQLKSVVAILGRNPSRNDVVRAIELKEGQQARVANVVAASRC